MARILCNVFVALSCAVPFSAQPLPELTHQAILARDAADYGRAHALAEQAANLAGRSPDASDAASAIVVFGEILEMEGNIPAAKQWLVRGLVARQRLYGDAHPLVADTLNDLALAYRHEGRMDDALRYYRRAQDIYEASDPQRLDIVLTNIGRVLTEQGKLKEAEAAFRQALLHSENAVTLSNLAGTLRLRHHFDEAAQLLQRAEAFDRQQFPKDHPRMAFHLTQRAALAMDRKHYGEAERLYLEALAIQEAHLPAGHMEIGKTRANLGEVYWQQKRTADAESSFAQALAILEKCWGRDHPNLLATIEHYAQTLRARQDFATAAALDARAMKIRITQALHRNG
jgi:tetratricopeptide (TPR) repeat protein